MEHSPDSAGADPIQLHLVLPYKFEPREDHRVRAYLERGYRIEQLQRLSDREALVTLTPPA
jgi:hypothetical protein